MNYPNIAVGSSEIQITYDPNENFSYLEICNQYFSTPKVNQESIFEREELIEEISTALDNIHLGSVLIEGPSGSGKSMAIQHTLDFGKIKTRTYTSTARVPRILLRKTAQTFRLAKWHY